MSEADEVLQRVRALSDATPEEPRPSLVLDAHLEWLDQLRESAKVNMWGAVPHLAREFGLSTADARVVHAYWMRTFPRSKGKANG